jgi:transcriptional regulator with XRE-family HTH domain
MRDEIKKFGQRIKGIRLKKGMSQGDVAKLLGTHRTYVSSMERGLRNPSLLTIRRIAKALRLSPKEIV